MKRQYRHMHLLIWLILGPVMAIILWLAVSLRPATPVNDELPSALTEEVS